MDIYLFPRDDEGRLQFDSSGGVSVTPRESFRKYLWMNGVTIKRLAEELEQAYFARLKKGECEAV